MTQNTRKSKLLKIVMFCFGCIIISLSVTNITVTAKDKDKYYIKINKQQNCITIYEKDENGDYTVPVKAMTCSTGYATPLGIYNTVEKYRWKLLMGDVWGQYSTRIFKGILFHSVWYYELDASTLSTTQFNKLGTTASHGCVRLTVEDAKWIYDNCSIGTTVEIYNDKDPGPLGKPETIKLKPGTGWDPTDPSSKNPFKDKTPTIKGVKSKTIEWGSEFDLLKGIKALSTTGMDITSKITVEGDVDIYTAGKYKVTYTVTDEIGRAATKKITIKVKESDEEPVFHGISDRGISRDTVVDRDFALEGVTATMVSRELAKDDIEVTITKEEDGSYTIKYSITVGNKKSASAVAHMYVDTTAPVIEGVEFKELTKEQVESGKSSIKELALEGIKVKDDYSKISKDKVKVTVRAYDTYAYRVTYKVSDDAGNVTTETVQFTYFEYVRINGVENHKNLPYDTEITKDYVKKGITAIDSDGNDITGAITARISSYAGGEYKVTYTVTDIYGYSITVVCYYFVDEEPEAHNVDNENSEKDQSKKEQSDKENLEKELDDVKSNEKSSEGNADEL